MILITIIDFLKYQIRYKYSLIFNYKTDSFGKNYL